ncbi:SPOR domain-containing protein [Phyllobacterium meliloti]|uniref:SPOR domain-containing protein n=1 Tax=Phyllobacterium meliloti TaxID=555317 RepID=UPI001D13F80E|nr:SPOR domain-containing protein [Phyllobacterium sp. T1293]UGX87179.1 SPOR domain-containing protein [Phyllobacterium sp. T1293]
MADNYLQRSHRQDDSRIGNDDPLMELSRIMGTPEEEENSATGSSEDFAMDLERELMGDFDEHPQAAAAQPAQAVHDHHPATAQDPFANFDLQDAVERELMSDEEPSHSHHVAEPVRQVISEPVAIYEEPDYADYEPEAAYVDSEAGEGADAHEPVSFTPEPTPAPSVEPAALYAEERPVVAAPSLSLEDELETLLAGSAKPVTQRSGNASWGYGSQAPVVGRTEAAPIISRATSYTAPVAQPAPVAAPAYVPEPAAYQAPIADEPVQVQESAPVQDDPLDDFDTEELMAAFDNFEVPVDIEDEAVAEPQAEARVEDAELPHYQSPVQSYAAVHQPVAFAPEPAVEAHHLPEPQDLSGYADELDRAASSIASAPDVHTMAVTESRVEYTESLDLPEVHYEDDAPQHNGMGELETEFAEVFGSIEAEDPRAAYAAPQEEPQSTAAPKDEYADIFADVFGNEAEKTGHAPANYAIAGAGVAAAAAGVAAASAHQARPVASNYSNGPEDDMDFGYDPKRDDVGMAATNYAQPASRKRSFMVPGAVAAAVLIAVSGAAAYKWMGGSGGTPVVIMADKAPIKVQPETTANATAPAQDKIVYEKGATADTSPPKQQQLVTTQEAPVDLAAADEDEDVAMNDTAGNKAEERVDPAAANVASTDQQAQPNNAIAPRKVQTMVVKPDGTMVAAIPQAADPVSSGPAAAPAARPVAAAAPAPVNAMPDGNDQIGSLAAASNPATPKPAVEPLIAKPQAPASGKLPAKAVETKKITSETVASVSPRNAPVVDRPADQPLNVVDRVAPQKATAQPVAQPQQVASAVAPGSYLIQVASQPTAEGAQKTYASLAQRYPGVIAGRGVDIKQAEIAGKGTFYRVRIPAGTKDAAVNLCTKFKSAGGSCFVTQ